MSDDMNDDFEVDNDDLPADTDNHVDGDDGEDDGFGFEGLTQAEIDAINAEDGDDDDSDDEADDDSGAQGADADSDAHADSQVDDYQATKQTTDDTGTGADDTDTSQQNDWQAEAATVADKRTAIDAEYDAEVEKLAELGKKYDDGDIMDGAYNAEKAKIDRNLKRIEVREAELVVKEDSISERQNTAEQTAQAEFIEVANAFFEKPENSVFVQGSPEHAALSQQYDFAVSNNPQGTPYEVLLNKARSAVAVHMTLPEVKAVAPTKGKKPEDKIMPSISGMPSVVANSADAGKFAHIEKLTGQDYENAVANMSEEQERAFLHS